jgi:CDP-diglyceride synthetase
MDELRKNAAGNWLIARRLNLFPACLSKIGSFFGFFHEVTSFFCKFVRFLKTMRELLTRTISGAVLVTVIIGSILLSPSLYAFLMLVVVVLGSAEMVKLHWPDSLKKQVLFVVIISVLSYGLAAAVALNYFPAKSLLFELIILMLPFLQALFTKEVGFEKIAAASYGSLFFLSLPAALMQFFYCHEVIGDFAGARLLVLVFALLWINDTFAYLTGSLLGKHRLFYRISPGKSIEGSVGGMLFTLLAVFIFCTFVDWMPLDLALGMAIISVIFGTFGDLCESMLKRQAGVKDSGKVIPGHGGILDRFDSVMFVVPFIFVYLILIK